MQVKHRLRLNVILSVAAAFAILLILLLAVYRLDRANNLTRLSGDIVLNSFDRLTLRNDYLQNNNERAKTQWFVRHDEISKILKLALVEFRASEDKQILEEMLKRHESIGKIFSAIVENREKKKSTAEDAGISREVEDRLLSQLNIKVYEKGVLGRELLESSRKARALTLRLTGIGIACLFLVLLSAVIINSWIMGRTITDRIHRLRDGASIIGGGNLDHSIDIRGDDEFSELAGSFNEMTAKLRGSYHDLEKEVEERKRAEEQVRRASAFNEAAMRSLGEGLYTIDDKGLVTSMNLAAEELFGWTFAELHGKKMHDMTHHHYRDGRPFPSTECAGFQVLTLGVPLKNHEDVFIRKDGTFFDVTYSIAPIRDGSGKIQGLVVVFSDITERKRAEEALRRSQKTFTELVERAPFGIYVVDSRFRIAQMNIGSQNGAFHNVRPVIGRDFTEAMRILWPEPVAVEIIGHFRHTLDTGEPFYSRDFIRPRSDVEMVEAYEWELHRMTLPDGHFGVICYYFDSTELRTAEEALRESEEKLSLALRSAGMGVWRLDLEEKSRYFDDQVCRCLGIDPDRFGGTVEEFYSAIHPDDRDDLRAALDRTIRSGIPYQVEYRALWPDGSIRHVASRGQLAKDTTGRPRWVDGLLWDVTERRQAEERVLSSLREKEVLLKEIHHRVKNNLQVIASLVGLQADGSKDETVRDVLRDVTDRVRSMALVHEKLYQSESLARVDFAEYARSLLSYLWRAYKAETVRLVLDLESVSFPVDVAVPCGLILNELAGNALKHAFRGRAEGEVTVSLRGNQDGRTVLSVRDNGVGLSPGFDWQQTNSLGLRLVHMLTGQLNAGLEVFSNGGTEFIIAVMNARQSDKPPLLSETPP